MTKRVSVFLADGFEEIEGLTVVDLLRRARINVTTVSITGTKKIHGAHGIDVMADCLLEEMNYDGEDMLVLPGGMPGTRNLEQVPLLMEQVKAFAAAGKYIAAICAAPSVFGHLGLLEGKNACCYPGFEEELTGANVMFHPCEADGNIITSRGMGCAIDFSLKIIEKLENDDTASKIGRQIIYF